MSSFRQAAFTLKWLIVIVMESGRTESVSAMGLTAGAHAKAVAARISEKNTDLSELVIQIALRRPAAVGNPSARVILGPAGFGMSTLLCTLAGRFVEDRAGSGFHAIRGRFSVGRRHSLCGRHVSELALSSLLGVADNELVGRGGYILIHGEQ
jgi:hypothetical protein